MRRATRTVRPGVKCLAAAALSAASVLLGSTALADESCAPLNYRLKMSSATPAAVYIRSEDSDRISRIMGATAIRGYVAKGVTVVGYNSAYSVSIQSDQLSDGSWCSRATDVSVKFDFKQPPEIYISRDIEPGSCFDGVVLDHENHHLAIARGALKSGRKWIEKGLSDYFSKGGERAASAAAANQIVQDNVKRIIDTVTSRLYAGADTRNKALDTPESYKALSEACGGND
jgi:hypothetical protein